MVLTLVTGLILANAAWNFIFFRLQNLRWSLWFYIPYSLFVAVLIYALWPADRVSAILLLVYSAYLPYAFVWSYVILKLNPTVGAHKGGPSRAASEELPC